MKNKSLESDVIIGLVEKLLYAEPAEVNHFNDLTRKSLSINNDLFTNPHDPRITAEAWYSLNEHFLPLWLAHKELLTIVECGEKIILGSFIATKLNDSDNSDEIKNALIKITKDNNPQLKILHDSGFYHLERYFDHCAEFGQKNAK